MAKEPQEKADDKMEREAKSLGVTTSKVTIGAGKAIKDPVAEAKRHEALIRQRTLNRIEKKKAKPLTPMQARKKLLTTRLASKTEYTQEQVRQMRFELRAIKGKNWEPPNIDKEGVKSGTRAPRKKSGYEAIMAMPA